MNAPTPELVDADAPKWCVMSFPPLDYVPCRHADESIVCSIVNGERELVTIALMFHGPSGPSGMFVALPPDAAREVAAGLIEKANEIDAGKGKQ